MGAQLNVKSEDAYRLASRLSELTGDSLTTVVTRALQAEVDREERARDVNERLKRIQALSRDIRDHLHTPITSDHSSLYDENGFPV